MIRIALLLATATASGSLFAADKTVMKPGQWDYTVKMEMVGAPFQLPPQTFSNCLFQKDLDQGSVAQDPETAKDCSIKNLKQGGGKISYDMVCKGENAMKAHAEFAVTATTLQGTQTMDMDGQVMKQVISAKRAGECPS